MCQQLDKILILWFSEVLNDQTISSVLFTEIERTKSNPDSACKNYRSQVVDELFCRFWRSICYIHKLDWLNCIKGCVVFRYGSGQNTEASLANPIQPELFFRNPSNLKNFHFLNIANSFAKNRQNWLKWEKNRPEVDRKQIMVTRDTTQ